MFIVKIRYRFGFFSETKSYSLNCKELLLTCCILLRIRPGIRSRKHQKQWISRLVSSRTQMSLRFGTARRVITRNVLKSIHWGCRKHSPDHQDLHHSKTQHSQRFSTNRTHHVQQLLFYCRHRASRCHQNRHQSSQGLSWPSNPRAKSVSEAMFDDTGKRPEPHLAT